MIYALFSTLNSVFQSIENIFLYIFKTCARLITGLFSFFNMLLTVLFKGLIWILLLPFNCIRSVFSYVKSPKENDSLKDQHVNTNTTTSYYKTDPLSSRGSTSSFSFFKGLFHIIFSPIRWILTLIFTIFSALSLSNFSGFLSLKKVKRTPTILQMEATECGSISLSIILAYYGHKLSPDEVREACGVSRDGSKASYILRAARRYHMTAQGYNIQDPNGLDQCPWPCILHWNFDHFVVFEGRRGNTFYINDPAYGRRRLSREEFGRSFTGVVLTLSKNKDFVKKRQKSPLLIFFRYALIGSFLALCAAILLGILQILPGLVIAGATKGFIDYVFLKSLYHWTPPLALVVVGAVIFQMILMFTQQRLLMRLHTHLTLNLASKVIHKLFYLPLTFFDQRLSGDVLYRFSSLQSLIDLLSLGVMGAFINLVSVVVFSLILYIISPILFTIVCAFIGIRILIFLLYKMRLRDRNLTYIQDAGRLSGIEMNGLQAIEMLKANNLESVFFKNWAANHDETLTKFNRAFITEQHYGIFLAFFASLMPLALLYQGASFVMDGSMSIGTLMAFTTLTSNLDAPIMTLLEFSGNLEKIKASISRIHDILMYKAGDKSFTESLSKATSPRKRHSRNFSSSSRHSRTKNWLGRIFNFYSSDPVEVIQPEPPTLHSEIFFHNITFGYTLFDPPLFENLSFVIPKGKTVAIVGSSGSGKSTLSKLLCGLYEPKEGEIFWDTLPISSLSSKDKSKLIALVDQDIFFFEGTVRDNLTAWNQNVSDDDLIKALVDVGLYDDLASRGLLRAHVAENGLNFSGGQRQRLEIARALVSKPEVFVLDEATSALDTISERKVFDTLRQQKATLLIIAHRLSTIQNADLIYVMDQGKIVQWGRHDDLIDHPGLYQNFLEREALS